MGLIDIPTVTILASEFNDLTRESERLDIIRKLLTENKYISTGDLRVILNVEKPEEGKCEE
jgi:hypothetical protein